MSENSTYEFLLNLSLLEVTKVSLDKHQLVINCRSKLGGGICPCCQQKTDLVNQRYNRTLSDLSISGREVLLALEVRQFYCSVCTRYFSEQFDFVSEHSHTTTRQAKWIFMLCEKQAHIQVASLVGISITQVTNIYKQGAEAILAACDRYSLVRNLGIDEIALRKGKGDYVCVLTDLDRGWVIDILPFRDKQRLIEHFRSKSDTFLQQIENVACDMWDGYISTAMAIFPNAAIIIDRFHVTMHLNEAIDNQRKALRKANPQAEELKNSKWALLKNPADLTQKEKEKLLSVFETSPILEELYEMKNTFKAIFDANFSKVFATQQIDYWIEQTQVIANQYLNRFVKTFNNYKKWICNYFDPKLSNGITEGCNNRIKTIKRQAYGMTNFRNFRLRVLTQLD